MKKDRNHEGYHDPTASKAIRRVGRRKRAKKQEQEHKVERLVYCIGDLEEFKRLMV